MSCGKSKQIKTIEIKDGSDDHAWYFFTPNGFEKTKLPQNALLAALKPWTESIRISDGNTGADGWGYFVVNHLGILVFDKHDIPTLIQDYHLFSSSTASNLVFEKGNAYFTLSRNSFFNKDSAEETSADDLNRPYLVRISTENSMLYPTITYGDLQVSDGAEVSGTYFDGENWVSSIKKDEEDRTEFHYIQWNSLGNMASFPAQTKDGKISVEESSEDFYRSLNSPKSFADTPERLRSLLSSIPKNFDFTVSCKTAGEDSPRYFVNGSPSGTTNASAVISDRWITAVFADGTTYFAGALEGHPLMNGGKNVALRLPKLPANYMYNSFCISGDYFVVSWEESDFYKTGRSGFLVVDLGRLFYTDNASEEG